jgi:hypothetical protein
MSNSSGQEPICNGTGLTNTSYRDEDVASEQRLFRSVIREGSTRDDLDSRNDLLFDINHYFRRWVEGLSATRRSRRPRVSPDFLLDGRVHLSSNQGSKALELVNQAWSKHSPSRGVDFRYLGRQCGGKFTGRAHMHNVEGAHFRLGTYW